MLVDEVPDAPGLDEEAVLIERTRRCGRCPRSPRPSVAYGARVFPGMTAREIAESDGILLGTVKTRLRSAMIKVRKANEGKELV